MYCNENMSPKSNFKRNYLESYNDSEVVVKTKNETSFMIFPNILFFYRIFSEWNGLLKIYMSVSFITSAGTNELFLVICDVEHKRFKVEILILNFKNYCLKLFRQYSGSCIGITSWRNLPSSIESSWLAK